MVASPLSAKSAGEFPIHVCCIGAECSCRRNCCAHPCALLPRVRRGNHSRFLRRNPRNAQRSCGIALPANMPHGQPQGTRLWHPHRAAAVCWASRPAYPTSTTCARCLATCGLHSASPRHGQGVVLIIHRLTHLSNHRPLTLWSVLGKLHSSSLVTWRAMSTRMSNNTQRVGGTMIDLSNLTGVLGTRQAAGLSFSSLHVFSMPARPTTLCHTPAYLHARQTTVSPSNHGG
jgi:hypothetical protein